MKHCRIPIQRIRPAALHFMRRNGFRLTGEKRIEDEVISLLKMERVTE